MKEKARRCLEYYGIRPSLQRMAVIEYLMTHHTHPTADDIFSALSPSIPTLSKTTIYNTLNTLVENKAILSLDIDPQQTHYDGDNSVHAHFICSGCGRIADIRMDVMGFSSLMGRNCPQGAVIDSVQVNFKGICEECRKHNKTQTN